MKYERVKVKTMVLYCHKCNKEFTTLYKFNFGSPNSYWICEECLKQLFEKNIGVY